MTTAQTGKETTRQAFSITLPEAMNVMLVGDFTDWRARPIRMHPKGYGVWTVTVDLPPGTHHYRFLVDGNLYGDIDYVRKV